VGEGLLAQVVLPDRDPPAPEESAKPEELDAPGLAGRDGVQAAQRDDRGEEDDEPGHGTGRARRLAIMVIPFRCGLSQI
jgi:hypothetical protein